MVSFTFSVPAKHRGMYPLDWTRSSPQQRQLQQGQDTGAQRRTISQSNSCFSFSCGRLAVEIMIFDKSKKLQTKLTSFEKKFVRCRHKLLLEGVKIFCQFPFWGAASCEWRLCTSVSRKESSSGLHMREKKCSLGNVTDRTASWIRPF